MGKMSCTGHLHSSPLVKDPYSNCVLGTELFCTQIPTNRGRRVYEGVWCNASPPTRLRMCRRDLVPGIRSPPSPPPDVLLCLVARRRWDGGDPSLPERSPPRGWCLA